ncbi:hypothetical protein WJX84_006810 [Apatococcus fuscideae]
MEEEQFKSFDEKGGFSVTSSPVALMTGGSKFKTEMRVVISPAEEGCKVTATIVCTAAGPWGMQGTIESVMVAEAEKGSNRFLDFCKQECANLIQPPIPSPAPSITPSQVEASERERYFDAQGSLDRSSSTASELPSIAQLEEDALGSGQATLTYLRQLHTKLCEVQQSQQRLESRLASLVTEMQASSKQPPQQPPGASPQGAISVTWQGYLPACLLLCSSAAVGAYVLDLLRFIHTGLEAKQHQSLLPAPAKNATAHLLR